MNNQPNIYKNKKPVFFFLFPAFLFLALYLFYPFFKNIINSFQIIKDLGAPAKGWNDPIYKNYAKLFTDKNMAIAMKNTLIMIVVTLLGQVGISRGEQNFSESFTFSPLWYLLPHSAFCST